MTNIHIRLYNFLEFFVATSCYDNLEKSNLREINAMEEGLLPLKKRKRDCNVETCATATPLKYPSWLPPGWRVEQKVRSSGSSKRAKDKYYVEPKHGRRLRSRKEVEYFIRRGVMPRSKEANYAPNVRKLPEMNSVVVPAPTLPTTTFPEDWPKQLDLNMDPIVKPKLMK